MTLTIPKLYDALDLRFGDAAVFPDRYKHPTVALLGQRCLMNVGKSNNGTMAMAVLFDATHSKDQPAYRWTVQSPRSKSAEYRHSPIPGTRKLQGRFNAAELDAYIRDCAFGACVLSADVGAKLGDLEALGQRGLEHRIAKLHADKGVQEAELYQQFLDRVAAS